MPSPEQGAAVRHWLRDMGSRRGLKRDLTNKADMADAEDYAAALAWAERLFLAAATCTLAVELLQLFWSACG